MATLVSVAIFLLHQKHLTSALNRTVKPALIMGRESRILSRQDAALIGHKLSQQIGVFEVQRIDSKVDFGFGPRGTHFGEGTSAAGTSLFGFVWASFSRHGLFDFAMQGVAAQRGIVLPQFEFFGFQLLIARRSVARR